MQAIHTKFLGPTNSRGARIKAYTAGFGEFKGFNVIIPYPYSKAGHLADFEAVKALVNKYKLDWDLSNMRFGTSADGEGYSFCFDCSTVED